MLDPAVWNTTTRTVRQTHIQCGGNVGTLITALNELALELADPTISEVHIVVDYDEVNLGTIDVTVSR